MQLVYHTQRVRDQTQYNNSILKNHVFKRGLGRLLQLPLEHIRHLTLEHAEIISAFVDYMLVHHCSARLFIMRALG